MRSGAAQFAVVALLAVFAGSPAAYSQNGPSGAKHARTTKAKLNTLKEVYSALRHCWMWPSMADISTGMDITFMLSFRRDGEIFGGRITHESRNVSANEQAIYYTALADAIRRCSPLPISDTLGQAMAGRPFIFRLIDTRKQKGA
jgi:hypothetical protein